MPKKASNIIKYTSLTEEQALLVFATKPNLTEMLTTIASAPKQFSPGKLLQDSREWPNLSAVLLVVPAEGLAFSFERATSDFNKRIASIASGANVKQVTVEEYRKGALLATRNRFAQANLALEANNSDSAAILQREEALKILILHDWAETAVKRKVKLKTVPKNLGMPDGKPSGSATAAALKPGQTQADPETPASAAHATEPPVTPPTNPTVELPVAIPEAKPKPRAEPTRFCLTGDQFPVKDQIKKMGGKFDGKNWWFPDAITQAQGQKIVEDYAASRRPAK